MTISFNKGFQKESWFSKAKTQKTHTYRRGRKGGRELAMGRPHCCDKVDIKKGPWTPEEDIILVTYIQEHGPGNWRSVPTNTGLLRCSKSCRLRWTNYLRPGIKRGNFTPREEGMIIRLQSLLGNKWAAIASYLPQRTDNDIKNYWNTHLKKKIKLQMVSSDDHVPHIPASISDHSTLHRKRKISDIAASDLASTNLTFNNDSSGLNIYASSTANISRLLPGWMRSSMKITGDTNAVDAFSRGASQEHMIGDSLATGPLRDYGPKTEQPQGEELMCNEVYESMLSFDKLNTSIGNWNPCSHKGLDDDDANIKDDYEEDVKHMKKSRPADDHKNDHPPFSFPENWLFDEASAGQVGDMMALPSIF